MVDVINWDEVEDSEDFRPIPTGDYPTEIVDCEEKCADSGNEYLNLKHEVIEGEYKGRFVYDKLFFSTGALKRVKLVCSRLGIKLTGSVALTPKMFIGKKTILTVDVESYVEDGKQKKSNSVGFAGYSEYKAGAVAVVSEIEETEAKNETEDDTEPPF